ncbi:MAG: hypothetical protein QM722_00270 [Piscinibacter sp.]
MSAQLSAEGILSLRPSLVLAIDGAGPAGRAEAGGAKPACAVERIAEDPPNRASSTRIARHRPPRRRGGRAEALAERGRARDFAALKIEREANRRAKRVLFVLSLQNGRAIVGGRHASADAIIAPRRRRQRGRGHRGLQADHRRGDHRGRADVVLMMTHGGDHRPPAAPLRHARLLARRPPRRTRRSSPWTRSTCSASARARPRRRAT